MSIEIATISELGGFVVASNDFTNHCPQLGRSKRFLQEIDRTQFHCADRIRNITVSRDNYCWGGDAFFPDQTQKFQAISTRHPQVKNGQVKELIMQQLNCFS